MDIDYYLVSAARRAHRLRIGRSHRIGREEGCDIHIQDALISRRHCEVVWDEAGTAWKAIDLGSRNGTLINGERFQGEQLLKDQDRLQVGGQVYQYLMVPPGSDLGVLSSQAPQISDEVTMGAGVSASEIISAGAAFTGEVRTGGVFELLQFLAQTRKIGRLDLIRGNLPVGAIGVIDGAVRDAVHGNVQGMDALLVLVGEPCTRFAFHADAELPVCRSIDGSC
ncbi:MAG: FHA domain-containing protein, partial [Planctomycetota bacterium]|nr:FHA domain-containing protein [Planctomycetota bacterium]